MKELLGGGRVTRKDVSIIIVCLNNEDSVEKCVQSASKVLDSCDQNGEVICLDMGSSDGTLKVIREQSASLLQAKGKGLGTAVAEAMEFAAGRHIVMADATGAYDFYEIGKFIDALQDGAAFVKGCRLPAGEGNIRPGALGVFSRCFLAPVYSFIVRACFKKNIHDVNCGFIGFTKDSFLKLGVRSSGAQFGLELLFKVLLSGKDVVQVPLTLHRRESRSGQARRTIEPGVCTVLTYLSIYVPWQYPASVGFVSVLIGLAGYLSFFFGLGGQAARLEFHSLICASIFIVLGYQSVCNALFTGTFAIHEKLIPAGDLSVLKRRWFNLELGLAVGIMLVLLGIGLMVYSALWWSGRPLGYTGISGAIRLAVPAAMFLMLGAQTFLASILLSVLRLALK